MRYEKVDAIEELGDDNEGLIFGIYWYDDEESEDIAEVEWFATEEEREEAISIELSQ